MLHAMLFLISYLNYQVVRPVLLSFLVIVVAASSKDCDMAIVADFPSTIDVCSICLHVQSQLMAQRGNPIIFQMPESFGQITPRRWRRGGQSSKSIPRLGTMSNSCH